MQQVTSTFSGTMFGHARSVTNGVLVSWDKTTNSGVQYFTIGTSSIGGNDILKTTGGGTIAQANEYKYTAIPASGVVSWSTSMMLDQYPYGIVQRQADVTLSNASKVYLTSSGTSMGRNIKSGRPVIIQTGFGGETIPVFTGYSDSPVNDIVGRTISMHCYDAIDYLNSYRSSTTTAQTNLTKSQIIDLLLQEAGFSPSQYILESSLDGLVAYFDPFNLMVGDIIRDFCEAEGAIFFADESGIMHYWNRQHFSNNATPVATLTYSGMTSLSQQDSPVLNYVSVTANPLSLVSGTNQVFSLDQPYYIQANGSSVTNLVTNPSFEVSTSGWSGSFVRTTNKAYSGSYSASGTVMVYDLTSTAVPSSDGFGYTVTVQCEIFPPLNTPVTVSLVGTAVGGQSITGTTSQTVSGTTWQQVTLQGNHYALTATGDVSAWSVLGTYTKASTGDASYTSASGYVYSSGVFGSGFHSYVAPASNPSATSSTISPYPAAYDNGLVSISGYIYSLGGYLVSNNNQTSAVYYAKVGSNGSPNSWSTTNSLRAVRAVMATVGYNNHIYSVGGYYAGAATDIVDIFAINSDGSLSTVSAGTTMSGGRYFNAAVAYNGYLYSMGGINTAGLSTNNVYYAPINADGTIGSWAATTNLPANMHGFGAFVQSGKMYIVGGLDNHGAGTTYSGVYYATINANGTLGTWTQTSSLSTAAASRLAYAYNNAAYTVGGGAYGGNLSAYDYETSSFSGSGVTVSGASTKPFYLDAVDSDITSTYFDGDSTSTNTYTYGWNGARGGSSSRRTALPNYLSMAVSLNYETYSLNTPVASGLNNPSIGATDSFYSFSSVSGTGGIYGTDLTSNVSLVNYSVSGTTAFLTFRNNSSNQAYLTNLVLYGQTAQQNTDFTQFYIDQNSINQYRLNPANNGQIKTISNNYIPTPGAALGLAEYIVQGYATPYLKHTTDIFTIPTLQFGDCVQVKNADTGETRLGYVMGITMTADANGINQNLIIQEKNIANYFKIGISTIGGSSQIAP